MDMSLLPQGNKPSSEFNQSFCAEEDWAQVAENLNNNRFYITFKETWDKEKVKTFFNNSMNGFVDDCTFLFTDNIFSQITKTLVRQHESNIPKIKEIAKEYRSQDWEHVNRDREIEDIFLRVCRELCSTSELIILLDDTFLNGLFADDIVILHHLQNECSCKLLIVSADIEVYKKTKIKYKDIFKFMDDIDNIPKVYISHHWDEDSDKYTNGICSALDSSHIIYGIDKNDAKYRTKLTDMEEKIGNGFIVIAIINEEYLRSIECMYELAMTCKNGHLADRFFPFITFDIKRTGEELKEQLDYWKREHDKCLESTQGLGLGNGNIENENIVRIDTIANQLPNIWEYFKKYLTSSKDELAADNFKILVNSIKERLATLPAGNGITSDNNTNGTLTQIQYGDHSTIINNVGNITIHYE